MVSKRAVSVIALAVLVILAGCSAGSGGGGGDAGVAGSGGDNYEQADAEADRPQATATGVPTEAASGSGGDTGGEAGGDGSAEDVQRANRDIIRTGTVVVEVADFESAQSNLTSTVQGYGGFVSDTRQDRREIGNETWVRGEVVLRVPSEDFDALVDDARDLGEVQSVETNSRDVTDQLVDIEARLENLRAEREQLRTLYERANTTEDVLAVQRELSDVQQEIERLEASQQSLENQVAFSTLTVRLEEPRPRPDRIAPDRWYDTPVISAFLESVDGAAVALRAAVVGFAFALPYLVVFGIPLAVVGIGFRRYGPRIRGRRGSEPKQEPAPESVSEQEPESEAEQEPASDSGSESEHES